MSGEYLCSGRAGFEDGALHAAGLTGRLVSDSMLFGHGVGRAGGVAWMREGVHGLEISRTIYER